MWTIGHLDSPDSPRFVGSTWVRPRYTSTANLWVIYSLALYPPALAYFVLPQALPPPSFAPGHPSQSHLPFRGVVVAALSPPSLVSFFSDAACLGCGLGHLPPASVQGYPLVATSITTLYFLGSASPWLAILLQGLLLHPSAFVCHPFIISSFPLPPCHHGAQTSLLKKTAYAG